MYESTAKEEYVDYVMTQEHGNHYNTKYFELGDFEVVAKSGMEIHVSEYSSTELTRKKHNFELEKDKNVNVRIDYKVSGVGSNSCGPDLLKQYRTDDKKVHFEFTVMKKT